MKQLIVDVLPLDRAIPVVTPEADTTTSASVRAGTRPRVLSKLFLRRAAITGFMAACMAGVIAISNKILIHQSLRLDESQSIWQASHSVHKLLQVVAHDVHVPLYHLILHFWIMYFGDSVTTIRLLSLSFFLASIPIMYLLARQLLRTGWALFATLLFSFSPFMNWYANEARMYTLLVLIALLNQYFFMRLIKAKKGWTGYALTVFVGIYVHYFFLFNLATQGIYYFFNRHHFAPGSFKRFLGIAILAAAEFLPWVLYFHTQGAGSNMSPLLARPTTVDFFNAYSQFLYGFQDNHVNTILVSSWPLLVLVGLMAVRRGQHFTADIGYIILVCILPISMAYVVSLTVKPFFLSRYMISIVPAMLILAVWLISHYARRIALAACALLLVIFGFTNYQQNVSASTPVKENYRQVADDLAIAAQPRDIIVLSAPFTVYPFEYYYHGHTQVTTLPIWNQPIWSQQSDVGVPPFEASQLPRQVDQIKANHQYVYLVLSQNQGYERQIKAYFDTHFKRIKSQNYSYNLNLYVYKVGYWSVPTL